MSIEVNTVRHEWLEGETIAGLLRRMNFIYPMVVVKVDGAVIPRTQYDSITINDGAKVEVIHLESGG